MATDSVAISKDVGATSFWQGAVVRFGTVLLRADFPVRCPNHFTRQTIAFFGFSSVAVGFDPRFRFQVWLAIAGGHQHFCGRSRKTWRLAHRAVPDSGHLDVAQVLDDSGPDDGADTDDSCS